MSRALLLTVHFHDGRYHGCLPDGGPEWPPSPARLFQALVAGAARGGTLRQDDQDALRWLEEQQEPPVIAVPIKRNGNGFNNFVPNNTLDTVGGNPSRIGEIKSSKHIRPLLFDARIPFLYVWHFRSNDALADGVCTLARRLYQFGRGVDLAWATAENLESDKAEARLASHPGVIHRPCKTGEKSVLACPQPGSLASLIERHKKSAARFEPLMVLSPTKKDPKRRKPSGQVYSQPRKALFAQVAYNTPNSYFLFDLMRGDGIPGFKSKPQTDAAWLVEQIRDRMAWLLERSFDKSLVERVVVGRGANETDKASRIRIVPLPSIGSPHADRAIRRVLIEVPPDCPVPAREIERAAGAVHLGANPDGEITPENESQPQLVRATDEAMIAHYGIGDSNKAFRLWRTVTPAALPESARRRRIDPARLRDPEAQKVAAERMEKEARARAAVVRALDHAGIAARPEAIRVQREPFARRGARAEGFAAGTRFPKERLWHVEIAFEKPVRGPLVIGDGRYLGLGLMAPESHVWRDVLVFALPPEPRLAPADAPALLRAVRRALMALSRDNRGNVPRLFSGHEPDGAPARSGNHDHVFLAAHDSDGGGRLDRLVVSAPWACDRAARRQRWDRERFDRVVSDLRTVRAGRLGVIVLGRPAAPGESDSLVGPACIWESHTPYRPTRHARRGKDPEAAIVRDVIAECARRGLPRPEVEVLKLDAGPRGGLAARLLLTFAVAVRGPLLLGRDSHQGGGLFDTTASAENEFS